MVMSLKPQNYRHHTIDPHEKKHKQHDVLCSTEQICKHAIIVCTTSPTCMMRIMQGYMSATNTTQRPTLDEKHSVLVA